VVHREAGTPTNTPWEAYTGVYTPSTIPREAYMGDIPSKPFHSGRHIWEIYPSKPPSGRHIWKYTLQPTLREAYMGGYTPPDTPQRGIYGRFILLTPLREAYRGDIPS